MFYISKIIWWPLQPGTLLMLCVAGGAVLLATRWQRLGRYLIGFAALLLVVGGMLPLSTWLLLPLEQRFARPELGAVPVAGIIVLGGGEDARVATGRGVHAMNEAGERLTEAAALAARYPAAKVIFTGGATEILREPTIGADAGGIILKDLGVGPERLLLERRSRNTWENALFTKALAAPKPGERWLLVTSAWHMPRAMGLFRKAGFAVEPWPTDYRTAGPADIWIPFNTPMEGLRRLDVAVKEWVGLAVNRLLGHSDALLPAPGAPAPG